MHSRSLNVMLISPPKQHNNSGNIQTAQNHYCYYGNVSFGPVFNFGGASRGSSSSSINNNGDAERTAASVPAVQ
jgi:hypothetical protein